MVRIAKNDTYGLEPVAGGVELRRRVVAGQPIPDGYVLPDDADFDEVDIAEGTVKTYDPDQITHRADVDRGEGKGASIHTVDHETDDPLQSPGELSKESGSDVHAGPGSEAESESSSSPRSRRKRGGAS
jgi:hypothetical protein